MLPIRTTNSHRSGKFSTPASTIPIFRKIIAGTNFTEFTRGQNIPNRIIVVTAIFPVETCWEEEKKQIRLVSTMPQPIYWCVLDLWNVRNLIKIKLTLRARKTFCANGLWLRCATTLRPSTPLYHASKLCRYHGKKLIWIRALTTLNTTDRNAERCSFVRKTFETVSPGTLKMQMVLLSARWSGGSSCAERWKLYA